MITRDVNTDILEIIPFVVFIDEIKILVIKYKPSYYLLFSIYCHTSNEIILLKNVYTLMELMYKKDLGTKRKIL